MGLTILLFAAGVAALVGGAWCLVVGSSRVAARLGVPSLFVGLTIVAWGTSAPELFVSLMAALQGSPDIMLGNIIGSNLANIGLVLGLALLAMRTEVEPDFWNRDLWALLGGTALFVLLLADGRLGRLDGVVLLLGFAAYTWMTLRSSMVHVRRRRLEQPGASRTVGLPRNLLLIVLGVAALVVGSRWIVDSAVVLARALDVPEMLVGWTLVAVGTSLPELATTLLAVVRRDGGIALGNVVGSNIFNLLAVGGPVVLIRPVAAEPGFFMREYLGLAVLTVVLVVPLLRTGLVWRRLGGLSLVALYALIVARRFGPDFGF